MGAANLAGHVENWPGFIGSGTELTSKIKEQMLTHDVKTENGEAVGLSLKNEIYTAHINDKEITSKAVIVALGMQHRKLGVAGEKELIGKGVSYCATCDGMFFRNKTVIVIGGSDSAAKAALFLSEIAKKVYVSYRKSEMRCEPISLKKIHGRENIEINYFTNPVEILGDTKVTGIILNKGDGDIKEEYKIDVDGIFIEIGASPVMEVLNGTGVELDERGFVKIDREGRTNIEGIFAAGDNTDSSFKQMIVAASEGSIAAKSAYNFIKFGKK